MDSFPDSFSFQTLNKINKEKVKKSEQLRNFRKMIYDTGISAEKDYFVFYLKTDVTSLAKEIILEELMEKFPCIAFKSKESTGDFTYSHTFSAHFSASKDKYRAIGLNKNTLKDAILSEVFVVGLTEHFQSNLKNYCF